MLDAARRARRRPRRARALHADAERRVRRAVAAPDHQHPPLVPARRSPARGPTTRPTSAASRSSAPRPLRHRGPRRGADHRAGRRARQPPRLGRRPDPQGPRPREGGPGPRRAGRTSSTASWSTAARPSSSADGQAWLRVTWWPAATSAPMMRSRVLAVARFDRHLDLGDLGRQIGEHPLVGDLDDVAALLADDGGEAGQRARHVGDGDARCGPAGPTRTSPCMITDARMRGSMLPPEITTPTRGRRSGRVRQARRQPAAPAPSATVFSTSSMQVHGVLDERPRHQDAGRRPGPR